MSGQESVLRLVCPAGHDASAVRVFSLLNWADNRVTRRQLSVYANRDGDERNVTATGACRRRGQRFRDEMDGIGRLRAVV